MPSYEGKTEAPDFPDGLDWLNTDRPLALAELRGKVVLLHFWTPSSVNCVHVLSDLKRLQRKYPAELVVVGVHSPRFAAEQDTANLRQAVLRHEIEHPVVNDHDLRLGSSYAVRAWPTLFVLDPRGKVLGYDSGNGAYDVFDGVIAGVIETFSAHGLLDSTPLQFALERAGVPDTPLCFPGKVLADEASGTLFVSDSNHHRIVVASLDGAVWYVIGSGAPGLDDGGFAEATLQRPQGLALDGQILYVADTGNHAVRRVDLASQHVTTIAGTGERARDARVTGYGTFLALDSPRDVLVNRGHLYLAMAGADRLCRMDLETGEITPHAGSGRKARIDGPMLRGALAQPSSLATDGRSLYFVDSDTSSVRVADLTPRGRLGTIVGRAFSEFGDRDGVGSKVRLQYPLGIAYHDGVLYVADTYNNKIKRITPQTKEATTFLGTGEGWLRDGVLPLFDGPCGVSVAGGRLYIADTNNHAIRVADLETKAVSMLELHGLEAARALGGAEPAAG